MVMLDLYSAILNEHVISKRRYEEMVSDHASLLVVIIALSLT